MDQDTRHRPLRLVVVDDQEFAREAVAAALDTEPGMETIGQAGTVAQARDVIEHADPDVVVLDLNMPDGSGRELLEHFAGRTDARFVVYTSSLGQFEADELRALGASDVVLKSLRGTDLVEAIRRVG